MFFPFLSFPVVFLFFSFNFLSFQVWLLMYSTNTANFPSHTGLGFSFSLKFTMRRCSRGVCPEYNWENRGKGNSASCPLTRHPHGPKRGVILCHKSLGSLNHTPDTLVPFLITVVSLHLYSIREINGTGYSTQVDILLWGTWLKCHSVRRTGWEKMGSSFIQDRWW